MNKKLGESFYDHMVKYFGEPIARETFRDASLGGTIQILFHSGVYSECMTLSSLGMSRFGRGRPGEVVLSVSSDWEAAASLLANAIFFRLQEGGGIHFGTVISGMENVDPLFCNRHNKTALYFTGCFGVPDEACRVPIGSDGHGEVIMAIFISTSERKFIEANSSDEFESRLEASNVDPYDLDRASVC